MEGAADALAAALAPLRTGRASPGLLASVKVEYHGQPTPLQQLASVAAQDARLLVVRPWDPGAAKEIERAILAAHVGLTPQLQGGVIRVPVPPLSQERREELAREAAKLAEAQRVAVRNVRRDALRELGRSGAPEDDRRRLEEAVEALAKTWVGKIDAALEAKARDLRAEDDRWKPS